MKQTVVQWLVEQVNADCHNSTFIRKELVDQAEAMFEEQIINSFDEGKSDGYKTAREWDEMIIWLSAEQYYNETYGGDK
jgi:hypothetical protein